MQVSEVITLTEEELVEIKEAMLTQTRYHQVVIDNLKQRVDRWVIGDNRVKTSDLCIVEKLTGKIWYGRDNSTDRMLKIMAKHRQTTI